MARIPRFVHHDQPTVYHIMSRTALDGFPLQDIEKDYLMATVARLCKIYFVDLLGFCLMGNHFHLVVRMNPPDGLTNEELAERYKLLYDKEAKTIPCQIDDFRNRLTSLGDFMKDISCFLWQGIRSKSLKQKDTHHGHHPFPAHYPGSYQG